MRPSFLSVCLFLVLGGGMLVLLNSDSNPNPNHGIRLRYDVEVVPGQGFEVTMTASGILEDRPAFRMLEGWGLVQDQPGHVSGHEARDTLGGTLPMTREDGPNETLWTLERRPEGDLVMRYRVRSHNPDIAPHASFVGAQRMLLLGYALFLLPDEIDHFAPLEASVHVTVPDGWKQWSSWPSDSQTFAPNTAHDLWSLVVAAGDYHDSSLRSFPLDMTVLTQGSGDPTLGLSISNRLFPVLREMFELFGAPPHGETLRVLAVYRTLAPQTTRSIMMGTSEAAAFLCVATPDRYRSLEDLTSLAAHECLHFYLGGAVTAAAEPPFRNAPDLVWLMEGVTEYLAYRLMEEAGVLAPAEAAAVTARKNLHYRESRASNFSLAQAARSMDDPEIYTLVYSRGYLVARLLDRELEERCGEGTLDTILRRLFEEHSVKRSGKAVNNDVLRELFEDACPGTWELVERYALGNTPLPHVETDTERVAVVGR